jgi:hypothetical protein
MKGIVWILILGSIALYLLNVYPVGTKLPTKPTSPPTPTIPAAPYSPPSKVSPPVIPDPEANLINPSWDQLKTFLLSDKTDEMQISFSADGVTLMVYSVGLFIKLLSS